MGAEEDVITAANDRATALAAGDADRLRELLHDQFRWTTHTGQTFDRSEYIRRNTGGITVWRSQDVSGAQVVIVEDTAVPYAEVVDEVLSDAGEPQTFRMPMTQVWVRVHDQWRCLAGHAGPRRT